MQRKLFISINIPEKTKKRLIKAVEPWQNLPVKWVKEQNLHVTLLFLGYISDDSIGEICESVRSAAGKIDTFDLEFTEIVLAPAKENPRMVWLTGKKSEELRVLQENIEKALGTYVASKKSFRPHVTLGRIRVHKWQALAENPDIFLKFPLTVPAESVQVMASDFADDGPEYTVIESCPLS
jgi:2'-5' RNA ligase